MLVIIFISLQMLCLNGENSPDRMSYFDALDAVIISYEIYCAIQLFNYCVTGWEGAALKHEGPPYSSSAIPN